MEIETDGTITHRHLRLYCASYCLILVLLTILVMSNRGRNISASIITYLIIIHSTEVSRPIFLTATLSLINRMHFCFISLPLLHYHDHPSGNPHSADTYHSVEFLLVMFLIQSSQHVDSVWSFLVVYLLQNFNENLCSHVPSSKLSILSIPSLHNFPIPLPSLSLKCWKIHCPSTLCTANPEMDLEIFPTVLQ